MPFIHQMSLPFVGPWRVRLSLTLANAKIAWEMSTCKWRQSKHMPVIPYVKIKHTSRHSHHMQLTNASAACRILTFQMHGFVRIGRRILQPWNPSSPHDCDGCLHLDNNCCYAICSMRKYRIDTPEFDGCVSCSNVRSTCPPGYASPCCIWSNL